MLKKRLIAVLTVKNGIVVQSLRFQKYLPVGKPEIAVEHLNNWGIDEIAIVRIDNTPLEAADVNLVKRVSRYCQVPLSYGGGLKTIEDITQIIQAGADKAMLNSALLGNPGLISEGARHFGNQCVIASIDAIRSPDSGKYFVWDHAKKTATTLQCTEIAAKAEALGAGEIFLNSVDRDGTKTGYDLNLAEQVAAKASVPVILCGGVGSSAHFSEGLSVKNVAAVAAGNFFHFTEHSATLAKAILFGKKQPIRMDSYFDYSDNPIDTEGRLAKKSDQALKALLFEFHPKEEI